MGLEDFRAEVMGINPRARRMLGRCFRRTQEKDLGPDGFSIVTRFTDWKGEGNPALEAAAKV